MEKHVVHYMNENVASMKDNDRAVFSHHMGVRPIRADAGDISQARRDRYYWCSWKCSPSPGVTVAPRDHYYQVSFAATLPPATDWADPGWTFCGTADTKLPTFMRALPKNKPTYMPAGIASTPEDAKKRWTTHRWRYPPYQYKREFCMRRKDNPRILRPLSASERELLMFLGRQATRFAMNPVAAKR